MTDINYTPEMVATLKAAQPIDYAKAQQLAKQLDRGVRSIIAKTKREGFDYISKPAPAKKKAAPTKGDMVDGYMLGPRYVTRLSRGSKNLLARLYLNFKWRFVRIRLTQTWLRPDMNTGLNHWRFNYEYTNFFWLHWLGTNGNLCLYYATFDRYCRADTLDRSGGRC